MQYLPKKRKKRPIFTLLISIMALFLAASLSGCSVHAGNGKKETRTGFYLNTVITITLYGNSSEELAELLDGCMELAGTYDSMFSRTLEGSDIWNINHSGGAPVTVQEETAALLETALSYAKLSDGLVDPSIGTLSMLWNFGEENQSIIPSDKQIKEALSHVNYRNLILEGNQVTLKDPEMKLDLGFIAKGYIADKMKAYLLSGSATSAIINLGGNVLTIGGKPDGTPFHIGIQKPFAKTGTALLTLDVKDKALVSSGTYERYFVKNDLLYHHILSTKDGYPINNGLSGVTIICNDAVDGDALSTLCFILGYEKGKELADSLQGVEAIFLASDGTVMK